MAAYKIASPLALYRFVKQTKNPDHPRLWPWIYRTYEATTPQVFVRNPYYYVVDPAGNQLPYIDRVLYLAGGRAAHVRDGAAMTRFLAWFEREAPRGGLTEISAAEALETFRR